MRAVYVYVVRATILWVCMVLCCYLMGVDIVYNIPIIDGVLCGILWVVMWVE